MDKEQGLTFDFESELETVNGAGTPQPNNVPHGAPPTVQQTKSYRQIVCRHWLRGLCMKGNNCAFLHRYDKSRMPVCRFFARNGECREPECLYKHSMEEIKECHMYKLGFCPNGPACRFRHVKQQGPPPPVEQQLAMLEQRLSKNQQDSLQNGPWK